RCRRQTYRVYNKARLPCTAGPTGAGGARGRHGGRREASARRLVPAGRCVVSCLVRGRFAAAAEAAVPSLQGAERLLGGGEVRVDLDRALVGVAGALRVALTAATLVRLAQPVVRLGARGLGQQGAVLRAPYGLVHLAGLQVGAGEVGEQRRQEHRAVHLHGLLEARQARLDVAALEQHDGQVGGRREAAGVEVHGLRQLVLGGGAVAQAVRDVAQVVVGDGAGGVEDDGAA